MRDGTLNSCERLAGFVAARIAEGEPFEAAPENQQVVAKLESGLPFPIPSPLRELYSAWSFVAFDFRGVHFFGFGDPSDAEGLARNLTSDPILARVLPSARAFYFAHPDTGSYDPIVVDVASGRVLWLDHEDLLIRERISVSKVIAESISSFLFGAA